MRPIDQILKLQAEVADGKIVQDQLLIAIERVKNENAQLTAKVSALSRRLAGKPTGPRLHRTDYDA